MTPSPDPQGQDSFPEIEALGGRLLKGRRGTSAQWQQGGGTQKAPSGVFNTLRGPATQHRGEGWEMSRRLAGRPMASRAGFGLLLTADEGE